MSRLLKKRRGESSRQSQTPFPPSIHGEGLKQFKKYMDRDVIFERNFIPPATWGIAQEQIRECKWEKLTKLDSFIIKPIVCEFYVSLRERLKIEGEPTVHSFTVEVRGRSIEITPALINTYLKVGVPNQCSFVQLQAEPPNNWALLVLRGLTMRSTRWYMEVGNPTVYSTLSVNRLNKFAKAWLHFINNVLLPSKHETSITAERALLLFCICRGGQIDVGRLLFRDLKAFALGKTGKNPPHPLLVFGLCKRLKVPYDMYEDKEINEDPKWGTIDATKLEGMWAWRGATHVPSGLGFTDYIRGIEMPKEASAKGNPARWPPHVVNVEDDDAEEEEAEEAGDEEDDEAGGDEEADQEMEDVGAAQGAPLGDEWRERFDRFEARQISFQEDMREWQRESRGFHEEMRRYHIEDRGFQHEVVQRNQQLIQYQAGLAGFTHDLYQQLPAIPGVDMSAVRAPPAFPERILEPFPSYDWFYQGYQSFQQQQRQSYQQYGPSSSQPHPPAPPTDRDDGGAS